MGDYGHQDALLLYGMYGQEVRWGDAWLKHDCSYFEQGRATRTAECDSTLKSILGIGYDRLVCSIEAWFYWNGRVRSNLWIMGNSAQ